MLDKNTFGEPVDCDTLFSFFFENNISIFTGPGTRNHKIDIVQIAQTALSCTLLYCNKMQGSEILFARTLSTDQHLHMTNRNVSNMTKHCKNYKSYHSQEKIKQVPIVSSCLSCLSFLFSLSCLSSVYVIQGQYFELGQNCENRSLQNIAKVVANQRKVSSSRCKGG